MVIEAPLLPLKSRIEAFTERASYQPWYGDARDVRFVGTEILSSIMPHISETGSCDPLMHLTHILDRFRAVLEDEDHELVPLLEAIERQWGR